MHFDPYTGSGDPHYPVKDGYIGTDDNVRGLVFRSKLRNPQAMKTGCMSSTRLRAPAAAASAYSVQCRHRLDWHTHVCEGGNNADPAACSLRLPWRPRT